MPPKSRQASGAKKVRRKEKKNIAQGEAHIKSTFNNTIVTIVLLKVLLMCASPWATFFFSLRRTFLAPEA
jgi:hypothetical protein